MLAGGAATRRRSEKAVWMAQRFLRSGIGRLMLALMLFAIAPAVALMAYLALAARAENERAAGLRQQEAAVASVRLAEELLDSARLAMKAAAEEAPRWGEGVASCMAGAARMAKAHPFIRRTAVVGGDGRVVCTSTGRGHGVFLGDRSYIRRALAAGEVVLGGPIASRLVEETVLPVALALAGAAAAGAEEPAVLVAVLDLDWLVRFLASGGAGAEDRFALLLADDGSVVAQAPAAVDETFRPVLARAVLAAPTGWARLADPAGGERILGFAHMLSVGMAVVVGVDAATLAPLDRRILIAFGLLALTALCGIAAAMALARIVVGRPVLALAAAADALAAGGPVPGLPARPWFGEFETLKTAFQRMRAEIARREAALEAANSELASANRLLSELAERDPLTGLANRRAFDVALSAAWKRAQREAMPVGLLILDIDHFKAFNDRYGHLEGDACLMRVGAVLAALPLRPYDLVARLGGEEFAVLLPDSDTAGAVAVGERIRTALHELMLLHEGSPIGFVTASIGAASMVPIARSEPRVLLAAADRALYAAKAAGRDRVAAAGLAAVA